MGFVLSSTHTALCSLVNVQLDKAEMSWLLACYPNLHDVYAEERDDKLRWLMGKEERECFIGPKDELQNHQNEKKKKDLEEFYGIQMMVMKLGQRHAKN
uniref:Uncharacterized protein n=1 Tax=Setaria viridis TaxID=4556 RepID=A0A4V6DCV6_SETVI|nr:hypothetical protein SEVIR_1G164000v2 [Setaria viridis]